MNKIWGILLTIILGAILGGILVLLLPLGPTTSAWALYTFVSLLHVGVAVLYMVGLKGFTYEFKIGYWYLAAAMVLYAVGVMELPLFSSIVTESEGGALAGAYYWAVLPFVLSLIIFYVGTRRLARVLAIRTILLSPPFVLLAGIVVGGAVGLVAYITNDDPSGGFSLALPFGVLGMALTFVAATCGILWRVKRRASVLYRPPFTWNFYGFLVFFVAQILDPSPFLPEGHWYVLFSLATPFLLSGLCFLKGAFEFNRIQHTEGHLVSASDGSSQLTSIDIVFAIAQLVSNPTFVDPELDKLRSITSQRQGDGKLTDVQQVALANLYKYLEDYLVQKEPARRYTVEGLRQMVDVSFRGSINEPTFWKRFDSF